jgi:hypothetical protein
LNNWKNKFVRISSTVKTLLARLAPFLRKEAAEKEVEEEPTKKDAAENPVARVIFIMSYFYV